MNSFVLRLVVLMALLAGSVFAGDISYTDGGADHLWSNSDNWKDGTIPNDSLTGAAFNNDGTVVQITNGINAVCKGFMLGMYGDTNSAEISGGGLTCSWLDVGRVNQNGGNGSLEITAGQINVSGGLNIPNQSSSMIDPAKMGVGHVDLLGGTIHCKSFYMGNRQVGDDGGIGTMDVTLGTLIVDGNEAAKIQGYIDDGWITAYGGIGDFLLDYDQRNAGMTTLSAGFDGQAVLVSPDDKGEGMLIDVQLVWGAGTGALSHDVHFGTVNPPPYIGNQLLGDVDHDPGELLHNTTYYWRIDEVTSGGANTGLVWSFTTGQLPEAAEALRPGDGQVDVKGNANIIWTPGDRAVTHEVYFGVDSAEVAAANDPYVLPGRGSFDFCVYDPGQLDPNTTYYLRVDERNAHGVTPGAVWSFTTGEAIEGDVNFDGVVDLNDLLEFASFWLDDCILYGQCGGADIVDSDKVDLEDYARLAMNIGPDENEPEFTDYCDMLSQEIQGKKHGFMAGNLTYYIGGFFPSWRHSEDETIGFTHPFHHDLRSRGHGMVQDANTGYGHDYSGWEFYKHTKVAYGSVYVGQTKYESPAPIRMYWRPDKMICEYEVGGVNIREEKFIAENDVACTIITSDSPVTLEFAGQSFANNKTVTTTATCQFDSSTNSVHVVEGGTAWVQPDNPETTDPKVGVMMYDGMSTVISSSRSITDYEKHPITDETDGQWGYSFKVPCDSQGTSLVWMMDDDYSNAVTWKDEVLADPEAAMDAKTEYMNDILNYQIPYFRCSDQQMVDIYYFLWSIYFMYYIDVQEGFEQYPHTQTAVNNFLGMHRYDAHFQTVVGAWITDKEKYANGNVLIWSGLLEFANLETGKIPADNMGTTWYSGLWGPTSPHAIAAWKIYEHSGDLAFLRKAYDFYKGLMWESLPGAWGYNYDAADRLAKMAVELGQPEDADHWYDLVNYDDMDSWLNNMWEKNGIEKYFGGQTDKLGWSGLAFMAMDDFPDEWAEQMTERWAVNEEEGFFHFGSISTCAYKDWDQQHPAFAFTPDTNWFAIRGMYEHHVGSNANKCALGHLKNYNLEWGIPVAPEALNINGDPWGDEYSNFNAGKILLFIEGILGLEYSVVDDIFTVSDHLPMEWDYMETIVPINEDGVVRWTKIRTERTENAQGVEKTITVEGNSMNTLHVAPWLEEKSLVSTSVEGYTEDTKNHIDYTFDGISDVNIVLQLEEYN